MKNKFQIQQNRARFRSFFKIFEIFSGLLSYDAPDRPSHERCIATRSLSLFLKISRDEESEREREREREKEEREREGRPVSERQMVDDELRSSDAGAA